MKPAPKLQFGYEYWVNQLIEVGKLIEPAKYTTEHISNILSEWRKRPFTQLVQMVEKRKAEHLSLINNQ